MSQTEDAELHLAIAAHRAGQLSAAEAHYRQYLKSQPGHGGANHNLGLLVAQRGAPELALEYFGIACEADPGRGQNWFSYAKAMLAAGRAKEALGLLGQARACGFSSPAFDVLLKKLEADAGAAPPVSLGAAHCREATAREPENAALHFDLGSVLADEGMIEDAIAAYRQAVLLKPDFAEAHFRLGSLLSENGRIAEGFAHYMRRAELAHGSAEAASLSRAEPLHKTKHDREQREYLAAAASGAGFHLEDGGRVAGPAVNPANATPTLLEQWRTASPQIVVIENFLAEEALEKLRRYCAGSTVWRRVYDAGYIGATPEDGFACPLLAQIAEEIRSTYAGILAPHRFHYLGAFKYDSALSSGTNTHADNAAVNVNFYIAPDEANLDPLSGGMDIWDVAASSETQMRRLNGDEAAAREFLTSSGARPSRVPHRANRAVIFKSDLFHKTSECRFREGYLYKRINVSLLFGDRGAANIRTEDTAD